MGKSKNNRTPQRRKPTRSQKKSPPKRPRLLSPDYSTDNIEEQLENGANLFTLFKKILDSDEQGNFISELAKLHKQYTDNNDLVQDFHTFMEAQNLNFQLGSAQSIARAADNLFSRYSLKLFLLKMFLLYTNEYMEQMWEINDHQEKYRYIVAETRLGGWMQKYVSDEFLRLVFKRPDASVDALMVGVTRSAKEIFDMFSSALSPKRCGLSGERYQQFSQELKDTVGDFMLQRARVVQAVNDKFIQLNKSDTEIAECLTQLREQKITDVNHEAAQPFEIFLSDDLGIPLKASSDVDMIYPTVLKIFVKYSIKNLYTWSDIIFTTCYSECQFDSSEFIEKMSEIRHKRLQAQQLIDAEKIAQSQDSSYQDSFDASQAEFDDESQETAATSSTDAKKEASKKDSSLRQQDRNELLSTLQASYPPPPNELAYHNNFAMLCAVVLSTKSSPDKVNAVTQKLFAAAPTPKDMAALGAEGIGSYIDSLALWQIKAERLAQIAQTIHRDYKDKVPDDSEALQKLPGIGPKTAQEILRLGFEPSFTADSHILRVCNRTGLCNGETIEQIEQLLPLLVKPELMVDAQYALSEHGRNVCTAKGFEDNCTTCVAAKWCKYHRDDKSSKSGKSGKPDKTERVKIHIQVVSQ